MRCTQKHSQVHTVHLGSLWKSSSWNLTSRNSYNLVYHSPFLTIDLILVHMANSQGVETRDGGQTNDEQSSLETKGIILSPHRIIWVQQGWLNIIEIAIRCASPLPKDQKTRFEVEILTTVWYQGKGHLIMFIGTNIRKLNWNKSSIYITDKEYFNFKHDC